MRHRLTFIIPPTTSHPASPEQFNLAETSLTISGLHATREDRFTLQLDELPSDVRYFFEELAIGDVEMVARWTGDRGYESVEPFVGRTTSGLNIVLRGENLDKVDQDGKGGVCGLAKKVFGRNGLEDCESIAQSFVQLPGNLHHFYSPTGKKVLEGFTEYMLEKLTSVCAGDGKCVSHFLAHRDDDGYTPAYIDITFAPKTKNLFVSVLNPHSSPFLSSGDGPSLLSTTIDKLNLEQITKNTNYQQEHKIEIGILDPRPPQGHNKPSDITLGGILAELGESKELEPVLFWFPSKHQRATKKAETYYYTANFKHPTGLHPKYHISIHSADQNEWEEKINNDRCKLHAWFTLPKGFFIDRYQLSDPQLLKSLNIRKLVSVYGETDLEAPIWTQERWGSDVLFEIDAESPSLGESDDDRHQNGDGNSEKVLEVQFPFHLRYFPPSPGKHEENATLPWPVVFWACNIEDLNKIQRNPFERKLLGWEFAYGQSNDEQDMVYYFLEPRLPHPSSSFSTINVPILNLDDAWIIKWGTGTAVFLGFAAVILAIIVVVAKRGTAEVKEKKEQ